MKMTVPWMTVIGPMRTGLPSLIFFFNDTATTEIYTLSLHDALPICERRPLAHCRGRRPRHRRRARGVRSEEHTSELQSQSNIVCRLLLENKNREQSSCPETCRTLS